MHTTYVLLSWFGAVLRRLEVMILHVNVADDVVVDNGVLTWTVVSRLLLGVIRPVF